MQKKVGDALYVLDLTPYVITEDTDVSIIYVQNEKIKEYKELNTELASKMHGFNQFIMAVQPLPWAEDGGGDDPGPGPDPGQTSHTLTVYWDPVFWPVAICGRVDANGTPSNEGELGWVECTNIFDEQDQDHITPIGCTRNNIPDGWRFQYDERNFPMGWGSDPWLEIDNNDTLWGIGTTWIMPASDTTIRLVGHAVKLLGNDIHNHVDVNINGDDLDCSADQWVKGICQNGGSIIKITPKSGLQPGWFSVIQGVEWDDNEQAWVATMPDSDLVIQIDYNGQPQTVLSWKYTPNGHDTYPTDFDMNNSFMIDPRALANLNGENPIMPELYINNTPAYDASDFTVTYSTTNTDLITVDQNGVISPVESSEGEYSYGFAAVNVDVHDNTGNYSDASTICRLELVHCKLLTKSTAGVPNEIVYDPLILGDSDNGFTASDCPVRFVNAYKDGVPYICSPEEFDMCGVPEGSTIGMWFDGDLSDITLKYTEEGMSNYNPMTYDTNDHWITFTMPNYDLLWTAVWNAENVTVISVTDNVGGHNGVNEDGNGGWYYKFRYLSAPDSYTNEVKYGHDYEYINYYGPNNFIFECLDGTGATVTLEPIQGGYSFSMADDYNGVSNPGNINFFVEEPPFDGLTVYYEVADETQPVKLLNLQASQPEADSAALEYPATISIDGELVYDVQRGDEAIYEYTFNTPGQHVVKYTFMNNYIPRELFYNINTISEIKIGEDITEVQGSQSQNGALLYYGAFTNCRGLHIITMSENIQTIGSSALTNYSTSAIIDSITIYATNPPHLATLALGASSNITAIYVPGTSVTAYQNAYDWNSYSSLIQAIPGTEPEPGES